MHSLNALSPTLKTYIVPNVRLNTRKLNMKIMHMKNKKKMDRECKYDNLGFFPRQRICLTLLARRYNSPQSV